MATYIPFFTKLAASVRRQDGVVALEGIAVCYTMDIGTR